MTRGMEKSNKSKDNDRVPLEDRVHLEDRRVLLLGLDNLSDRALGHGHKSGLYNRTTANPATIIKIPTDPPDHLPALLQSNKLHPEIEDRIKNEHKARIER